MFGKRKLPDEDPKQDPVASPTGSPMGAPGAPPAARQFARPDAAPPRPGVPGAPARPAAPAAAAAAAAPQRSSAASAANDSRKLVVGAGIRLSGDIKACETLVVEGQVEANLNSCKTLEIAETGLYKGAAVVEEVEVSGCFEGELTAKGRLFVRSTGRVDGSLHYADLEIERGGKISGEINVIGETRRASGEGGVSVPSPKPATGEAQAG